MKENILFYFREIFAVKGLIEMPKYKHGKKTTVLSFKEFSEQFDNGIFKRGSHRSFLAFLYWFGVRVTEALNLRKEDFSLKDGVLIVDCQPLKHGKREPLEIFVDLPYVELIIQRWRKTRKGRKLWGFSSVTAWRIVKRVMGEECYPHFFRLNRAVAFLDDPETTIPEMMAWFGWRGSDTYQNYLGYSRRHVQKQRDRLRQQIQT